MIRLTPDATQSRFLNGLLGRHHREKINYRVTNMERLLAQLRRDGVTVEKVKDDAFGRFAWISDPEGNRIELWEPKGK